MINENIDPRMAIAQVLGELETAEESDAFMTKIQSAKSNVEAYQICLDTLMGVNR